MIRRRTKSRRPELRPHREPPKAGRRRDRGVPVPEELKIENRGQTPFAAERTSVPPDGKRGLTPVLVTGFDAFGGEHSNPSWEVCTKLPNTIAGLRVETCRVPCEFHRAIEIVAAAIERHQPQLVICLGQAGGRAHLSVERVAINVDDARIADNGGAKPIDEAIAADGPPAYFATLPIKAMVAAMRSARVPAEVSNSAGTYVCNHLMYGVLHHLATLTPALSQGRGKVRAGFIHVPYSEEQVVDKPGVAGMAIASMVRGIEAAIAAAAQHTQDVKIEGGALD